ncbi:POLA2 [Symbiodinium natans]|uniref:POLA2 protein n=1 Tax=Symbiodinium natans TaxID=878477 RepID=A0A812UFS2_9DINO|nr:POLA2 [Symbiodinium natans]
MRSKSPSLKRTVQFFVIALVIHHSWYLCWSSPAGPTTGKCCDVSIVLVTSPIPSHPSTELVDEVIRSFDLVQGLELCPLVIVADGFQVREGRPAWNQGRIDESTRQKYLGYVDALKSKYGPVGTGADGAESADGRAVKVVGPLAKRVNFGHALLAGLSEVHSEFVVVVQHDRVFAERLDMGRVLSLFDKYKEGLRYVGFQTVPDYVTYAVSKYGGWARSELSEKETGLIPCFIWYDSTHVCRTRDLARLIAREVKPGEFIESSFGCRLLAKIQEKKDKWNFAYHMEKYGLFLYYEPTVGARGPELKNHVTWHTRPLLSYFPTLQHEIAERLLHEEHLGPVNGLRPLVRHVSGRSFVSREERIKMGWPAERPSAARRVRHVRQGNQGDAYSPLDGLDTLPLDSDDADQKV